MGEDAQPILPSVDDPDEAARLEELERRLRVEFRDRKILQLALVHRSLLREYPEAGLQSNERLEFLGDAIIGALVAKYLYDHMPGAPEGELTLARTSIVRASTLGEWGTGLELHQFLKLGHSDETSGRRTRLLARTFEAVVGAMYADRGVKTVRLFLKPYLNAEMKRLRGGLTLDAKSRLQQITQTRYEVIPAYTVLEMSGPGHDPTFTVRVQVGEVYQATALGRTKQEAEQAAARLALEALDTEGSAPPPPASGG